MLFVFSTLQVKLLVTKNYDSNFFPVLNVYILVCLFFSVVAETNECIVLGFLYTDSDAASNFLCHCIFASKVIVNSSVFFFFLFFLNSCWQVL